MWSWWSLWFLVKWSKFQNQVKKNLDFFLFFLYFHIFSSLQNWQMVSWQSVFCWSNIARQVTQGRFLGEKKWGRSYVHELPGWNRWFDDAANLSSPIFSKDTISCLRLKPTFCCCFSKKKQRSYYSSLEVSFKGWGYFKMRLDFAVEVVGHTRSESSKDLGRAIGPGNFAACAVRMESFGRKPQEDLCPEPPQMPSSGRNKAWRSCSGTNMNNTPWIRSDFLKKLGHWGGWASFHEFFQQASQRFRYTSGLMGPFNHPLAALGP